MKDDKDLISEYLSGKEEAIEELVMKHQKMVFALVYRMTHDIEQAKDLTQETFVRAIQGLKKFRMDSSFKTWLYRVATNICLNHIRKHKPEENDIHDTVIKSNPMALTLIIEKEKNHYLKESLKRLPERQRLAVTLRVYEGLSCLETAGVMECSAGAVKAHYHNGIKKIREILKESGYEKGA